MRAPLVSAALIAMITAAAGPADDEPIVLSRNLDKTVWRSDPAAWFIAGDAKLDPKNPRRLVGTEGAGVLINGPTGRTINLVTRDEFADIDFHCEFLVPKGSNSGVKFEGLYEIQILDSYGQEPPKAQHCGGIYPRAQLLPTYHYLDEGIPPRVNACKPPGTWQSLDATFLAPRFDAAGKKVRNARLLVVTLNGERIHENVELKTPTGHAWPLEEHPRGPILLQADHGPVAFRNVTVRPRSDSASSR